MLTLSECEKDISEILSSLPQAEIQHMRRVGALVELLSKKMYESKYLEESKYFGESAFFHDIGKAWVPTEILTKPDRLTEKEKSLMFQHPLFAKRLFDRNDDGVVKGVPKHLIPLVIQSSVYHHEWWNGAGYPYGISYDAIPLIARITTICDAYDAMTSNRVYRRAHTHAYACQQIEENMGIQFAPDLAHTFLNHEAEFATVFKVKKISCF
jgi:putative two-component system response regulator